MELPLVGGGEHDWNYLLSVWGALPRDTQIAHDIRFVGAIVAATAVWIGWRYTETTVDGRRSTVEVA
jgi:hypothetical protein